MLVTMVPFFLLVQRPPDKAVLGHYITPIFSEEGCRQIQGKVAEV